MAGLCSTGAPASRWKRHIVRQLRQRDHTQKTLFLELVPACECSLGGLEDSRAGDWALGEYLSRFSDCDSGVPTPSGLRSLGPAWIPSLLHLISD